MTSIQLDDDTLRPLVAAVVQHTLSQLHHVSPTGESRIAWSEAEAAELLGMKQYQLRDRRIEGRVQATKVGRSWFYTREALLGLFKDDAEEKRVQRNRERAKGQEAGAS